MTVQTVARDIPAVFSPRSMPLWIGVAVYALLVLLGPKLLNDPDTYSHIALGRWMLTNQAVPFTDPFTHTASGNHWVAFEWLSQVAFAAVHAVGGWPAVIMLAAASVALSLALLARFLLRELAPMPTLILVTAAFVLMSPHILARPHVLAFPLMVMWVGALVRAVDRGEAPPLHLVPLMILWANLHGSFTLGLAIVLPIAVEAAWCAAPEKRNTVARQWLFFAVLSAAAGCVTPYGPELMVVTYRTIALGQALLIITEWRPQDFSRIGPFEILMLSGFGYALYRRIALPPLRILMLLGLLHLALSQSRHADVLALLGPLFLARPLAREFGNDFVAAMPSHSQVRAIAAASFVLAAASTTAVLRPVSPAARITPAAAVAAADLRNAGPILNDYDFGGYLDFIGIAPFIDGRTELYGRDFTLRYQRAATLQSLPDFLDLLQEYQIRATLLAPETAAVALLDRLSGWQRVYADDIAVVHARRNSTQSEPGPGALAPRAAIND